MLSEAKEVDYMATRVYELAKELGVGNKEMLNKLNGMGIEVSSHMNVVSEKDCLAVRNAMAKGEKAKKERIRNPLSERKSRKRRSRRLNVRTGTSIRAKTGRSSRNRARKDAAREKEKRARIRFPELLRKRRRTCPQRPASEEQF